MSKARIHLPQDQIAGFCRRHHVRKLALFGSVLRDDFRPDSDVDVLVEFEPDTRLRLADLMQIEQELQRLFGRKVDVVEKKALHNPFRRHEILTTREVIYAA